MAAAVARVVLGDEQLNVFALANVAQAVGLFLFLLQAN
jgi:hypothetical protein